MTLSNNTTATQNEMILHHLEQGHSITALEALNMFDCFRLSARINDLKSRGKKIDKTMIEVNGKRVARYFIPGA